MLGLWQAMKEGLAQGWREAQEAEAVKERHRTARKAQQQGYHDAWMERDPRTEGELWRLFKIDVAEAYNFGYQDGHQEKEKFFNKGPKVLKSREPKY